MVEGVIARGIPTFPLLPRPKRAIRVADGSTGARAARGGVRHAWAATRRWAIHLSEVPAGGEKQGHRHLDEATFYIISGRGWSELRQGEDVPDQRVDWQAGDIVTIPSNAWHKHYNASHPDAPALQIAFKNTRWLRKLFHSREFVYANDFRFPDRYNDEPDYWTRRDDGNYGKVKIELHPRRRRRRSWPDPSPASASGCAATRWAATGPSTMPWSRSPSAAPCARTARSPRRRC